MPIVASNEFYDNHAREGGGIRFCYFLGSIPEPVVTHNLVYDNAADSAGGGISVFAAGPDLHQMTIDANSARKGGGVYVYDNGAQGAATFTNCIVANSRMGGGIYDVIPGGVVTTKYCDVWNNVGGDYVGCSPDSTDLSADPEYCDAADRGFWIYETSACVGSGWYGSDIGRYGVGCFRTANVIFYDNWSDQNSTGWREETAGGGSWSVVWGRYEGSAGETLPGFARAWVDTLNAVDFSYQVELRPLGSVGISGLLFRRAEGSTYRVRLDGALGSLEKETPEGTQTLASFSCPMAAGETYTFLARVVQGSLGAWYRDPSAGGTWMPLFAVYDEDPLPSGSVGMEVVDGATASFDNVLVATVSPTGVADRGPRGGDEPGAEGLVFTRISPNPFRGSAEIAFSLRRNGFVDASIYNLSGERVRMLVSGTMDKGPHSLVWDGRDGSGAPAGSGVYLCRVRAGRELETRKILLTR